MYAYGFKIIIEVVKFILISIILSRLCIKLDLFDTLTFWSYQASCAIIYCETFIQWVFFCFNIVGSLMLSSSIVLRCLGGIIITFWHRIIHWIFSVFLAITNMLQGFVQLARLSLKAFILFYLKFIRISKRTH